MLTPLPPSLGGVVRALGVLFLVFLIGQRELAEACGRFFKMRITATKNTGEGAECNYPQLSELRLYDDGVYVGVGSIQTIQAFRDTTSTPATSPPTETVGMLVDGNSGTKFLSQQLDTTVKITFTSSRCINSYDYLTANDAECRDPVSWTISESVDDVTYTTLQTITGASITPNRQQPSPVFSYSNTRTPTSIPSNSPTVPAPTASPTTPVPSSSPTISAPTTSPTTSTPTASPSTSSPTASPSTSHPSMAPSLAPSASPTTSIPTKSPTLRAPQVISARLANDLSSIVVDFDVPTTYGAFQVQRTCSPMVVLETVDDTGCNGEACPALCRFVTRTQLVILLNSKSTFTNVTGVTISSAAGVAQFNDNQELGYAVAEASVVILPPLEPLRPVVTIAGPAIVSLCSGVAPILRSQSSGGGGRPLTFQWYANSVAVTGATSNTFIPALPSSAGSIPYELKVFNWYGERKTASLEIDFTSNATCSVSLVHPTELNPRTSNSLTIEASALVSVNCLPAGYNASDVKLTYTWSIQDATSEEFLNVSAIDPRGSPTARLRISPLSVLTPGRQFNVFVAVQTGIPGLEGNASSVLLVSPATPIARIANASVVTTDSVARLDASASCDPNLPVPLCNEMNRGQTARNTSGLKSLRWFCTKASGEPCFNEGVSEIVDCANVATCDFDPSDVLDFEGSGPFAVTVAVESFTSAQASLSSPVLVRYLPQTDECPYPALTAACSCNSKQVINADEDLRLSVTSVMPSEWFLLPTSIPRTQTIQWSYSTGDNNTFIDIGNAVAPGRVLVLSKQGGFLLVQGSTYTFRATSLQRCGEGRALRFSEVYSDVTLTVNGPPVGGELTVSPSSGNISTSFTMTCGGFVDGDLPLQYSFAMWTRGAWQTLGPAFSDSAIIVTRLPANATGHTIICRARDGYQAVSSLESAPKATGIVVDVPSADEVLQSTNNLGSDLASALASGASPEQLMSDLNVAIGNIQQLLLADASQEEKDNIRGVLIDGLSLLSVQLGDAPTGAQSQQVLQVLTNIVGDEPLNGSDPRGAQVLALATSVLGNMLDQVKNAQLSGLNEGADRANPSDVASSATGLVRTIVSSLQNSAPEAPSSEATRAPTSAGGRRLQSSGQQQESVIQTTRKVLRDLADVLLADYLEGETPFVLPAGVDIKLVGAVATPDTIGTEWSLQELVIPAFDEADPPTVIFLPRNLLQGATNDTRSRVNIVAARFRFNVRELITSGLVNFTLDALAPVNRVEEVVALDFQRPSRAEPYHPSNLTEPIRLKLPLTFDQLPPTNETKLACGFWEEAESRWSSFGCNVTDYRLPENATDKSGWIMCECNHASDYAAWRAFVEDLTVVFKPVDLGSVSTIAAVVCGILLPAITVFWLIAARLGRKRDLLDSRLVHLGTFVTITRRKLMLHERQRRFFSVLRHNKGLSAKQLVQVIQKEQEEEKRRRSDLLNSQTDDDDSKAFYLKTVILGIVRTLAVTYALAAALFVTGTVIRPFFSDSGSSLTSLASSPAPDRNVFKATQALVGVSVFLCFSALLVCLLLLFRRGRVSQEFKLLISTSFMACVIGIAAFAHPVSHSASHGGASGSGIGLIVAAGAICIANFILSCVAWFIRVYQDDSRSIIIEFLENCGRGLVYEQSLVSIFTRFDPYLDRQKRFSLFVAIVVGNLFASSFFFSLKVAEETSIGFMIGTVILCAFVVAIPIKFTVKLLFKTTAARKGSSMDRVAQIFRIVAFSNDVHPAFANEAQKMDVNLLYALKKFYIDKYQTNLLEAAYEKQTRMEDDLDRVARGLSPRGTYEYFLPRLLHFDVLCQSLAVAFLIAGLAVKDFGLDGSGTPVRDPAADALGIVSIIVAAALLAVQLYLVLRGKSAAPKLFKVLIGLHLLLCAFIIPAFAAPVASLAVMLAGLDFFIVAASVSLLGQAAFALALYMYYMCAPAITSIHRFARSAEGGEVSNAVQGDDEADPSARDRASSARLSKRAATSGGGIVEAPMELSAVNPIAMKEISIAKHTHFSPALSVSDSTDRRTGEFAVAGEGDRKLRLDTLNRAMSSRLDSKRFARTTEALERISKHDFVESALQKSADAKITPEMIQVARARLEQSKAELRKISELSRLAWLRMNPLNLTAKQLVVRREQTVGLKLARLLSEEATPRPKPLKRWLPNKIVFISWAALLLYCTFPWKHPPTALFDDDQYDASLPIATTIALTTKMNQLSRYRLLSVDLRLDLFS